MKSNILILILALVLSLSMTSAVEPVDISITRINTSILLDQSGSYELRIINHQNFEDTFQISSDSSRFLVMTQPRMESMPIAPNSFEKFTILVSPKSNTGFGPFAVPVKIRSLKTNTLYTVNLPLHIQDPSLPGLEYPPNPSLRVDLPESVDPRNGLKLNLQLRNRNPRDLKEITIEIDGSLVQKTYTTNLNGMEEKGNEITFDLHPLERPGTHTIVTRVLFEDKVYAEETKIFRIASYSETSSEQKDKRQLFKSETEYVYRNIGNSGASVTKKVPTNWLRLLFTTTFPNADRVTENGATYLKWNVVLPAQDMDGSLKEERLVVVENYRLPVFLLVFAGIVTLLYFYLRSPVVCKKHAHISHTREGVSHIKVKLFIKNRCRKKVDAIRVIERVPAIAEFEKSEALGTLHPSRITNSAKRGTIVHYELHSLDPFEERIITYSMKSKLKIIGSISLRQAKVKFEAQEGVQRVILSNKIRLAKRN